MMTTSVRSAEGTLPTLSRLRPAGAGSARLSLLAALMQQAGGAAGAAGAAALPDGAAPDAGGGAAPSISLPGGDYTGPLLSYGGSPDDHGRRALGNWQSDSAYDLMGKAGTPIYSTGTGRVTQVSGAPGGSPQFAGYGVTVSTPQGDLFFKHLGSTGLKAGARVTPGMLLGTLDGATAGGPHLHLGGTNRSLLDALMRAYTGRQK